MSSVYGILENMGQDVVSWFQPIFRDIFPKTTADIIVDQAGIYDQDNDAYIESAQKTIELAKVVFGAVFVGMVIKGQPLAGLVTAGAGALAIIAIKTFVYFIQQPEAVDESLATLNQSGYSIHNQSLRHDDTLNDSRVSDNFAAASISQIDPNFSTAGDSQVSNNFSASFASQDAQGFDASLDE